MVNDLDIIFFICEGHFLSDLNLIKLPIRMTICIAIFVNVMGSLHVVIAGMK